MFTVLKYTPCKKKYWNSFVNSSKNGTFLFQRDFMEYHSSRFKDFSLMIYHHQKLIALLPANINNNIVYSHQGLSYGGILVSKNIKFTEHTLVYQSVLFFLKRENIRQLVIKEIPIIYNHQNDELTVLAHYLKSEILVTDLYTYFNTQEKLSPNRNRKRGLKTAQLNQIKIIQNNDFSSFWNQLLIPNLESRFKSTPVHSLDEILSLQKKFPNEILFFGAYKDQMLKAGAVMFLSKNVAHFQYSAGSIDDRNDGSLDLLFYEIMRHFIPQTKYISFGSSSGSITNSINQGVLYWKESYGTENIVQRTYAINTSKGSMLETLFE